MSTCWSVWGHLGTIEMEDCVFEGDPFVSPGGTKAGDGPCILTHADQSKGAWLDEDGNAVSRLIVRNLTIKTSNQTGHFINLGSCGDFQLLGFNFKGAGIKPYLSLRNIYDQSTNALGENGRVTILPGVSAPTVAPLYTYDGWHPSTLPGKPQEEYRCWYKKDKLQSKSTINHPVEFPAGYGKATFDEFAATKVFSVLK